MMVMDSSGSVFNSFDDERKLVHDLISSLIPEALKDGRIQVFHKFYFKTSFYL